MQQLAPTKTFQDCVQDLDAAIGSATHRVTPREVVTISMLPDKLDTRGGLRSKFFDVMHSRLENLSLPEQHNPHALLVDTLIKNSSRADPRRTNILGQLMVFAESATQGGMHQAAARYFETYMFSANGFDDKGNLRVAKKAIAASEHAIDDHTPQAAFDMLSTVRFLLFFQKGPHSRYANQLAAFIKSTANEASRIDFFCGSAAARDFAMSALPPDELARIREKAPQDSEYTPSRRALVVRKNFLPVVYKR